jgi:hypothetical protein
MGRFTDFMVSQGVTAGGYRLTLAACGGWGPNQIRPADGKGAMCYAALGISSSEKYTAF